MPKFNKDSWILDALRKRYIVARADGSIWRATSHAEFEKKGWYGDETVFRQIKVQTHKRTGRVYFNMTWRGVKKSVLVNRVVALRFLPNPERLPQVNHKNGIKADNSLSNLEWSSGSDNERHAHRTGLKSGRGSANSNAKLSVDQILAIRASEASTADLANQFGVSRATINNIIQRKTWTHV